MTDTNIKEVEPEKAIIVNKFNFTCDTCDSTIPKPLPQQGGFAWLIVGNPEAVKPIYFSI